MLAANLTRGTSGNASARLPDGRSMLITPSAVPYPELEPDMLLEVALDAEGAGPVLQHDKRSLRPSTEWRMHAAVLRARSDVEVVLHAHPPFATALACLRRGIPAFH